MIRLIAFFQVPHREVLRRVRESARGLTGLDGVSSVAATVRVDVVGDRRQAGPVLELEFRDVDAMRAALASSAWRRVAAASTGGPPILHAYEVEPMEPAAEPMEPAASEA